MVACPWARVSLIRHCMDWILGDGKEISMVRESRQNPRKITYSLDVRILLSRLRINPRAVKRCIGVAMWARASSLELAMNSMSSNNPDSQPSQNCHYRLEEFVKT